MRNLPETRSIMILKVFLPVIIISLLAGACVDKGNKPDKRNLIPEKDLISILSDVHLADGLLLLPKIRSMYSEKDSVMNYIDIIEGHGYTKEAMDRTMKYYFLWKPKKLIRIYDRVLEKLSELDSYYTRESEKIPFIFENLWRGKSSYCLPDPAGNDSMSFDLKLDKPGTYKLTFTVTLFPTDLSVNPHFTAYLCHPDSVGTGVRTYLPAIDYIKDGQPHTYTISQDTQVNTYYHMKGWFYDCGNLKDEMMKNVRIENISLTFTLKII